MTTNTYTAACLLAALALGGCASATAPFNDAISQAQLRADLYALAHDTTRGRLVGTPEIVKASDWVSGRFLSLGLEPGGDGATFDQRFDLMWFSLGQGNRLTVSGAGGARESGAEWYPLNFSATGSASGEVVFAGYGIDEPRLGYDDYKSMDVRGKIVLVLEREPGVDDPSSPFDGIVTAESARPFRKALAAQKRGAVGILFVRDVHTRSDVTNWEQSARAAWPEAPRRIETFALAEWMRAVMIPGAQISAALAEVLVKGSGSSLNELATAAESAPKGLGVKALPGSHVSMTTAVERHITPGRNIAAMVTGSDSLLKNEVVIIVGHHDHNGADGDTIYNGADDNASGAVGVMAVAEAYARSAAQGRRPRRSVMFVISDAEERGLSGAWHMTLHPRFPLHNTAAVFNVDMIGRNQEVPANGGARFAGLEVQTAESNANAVNILGYSRAPELAAAVERANRTTGLTLRMRYDNNASNLLRRSDHWPYLQNDVPAVWFHTGLHPDYHTPDDDAERINYEKLTRIVRLIHQVSWDIANADGRPTVTTMGPKPPS